VSIELYLSHQANGARFFSTICIYHLPKTRNHKRNFALRSKDILIYLQEKEVYSLCQVNCTHSREKESQESKSPSSLVLLLVETSERSSSTSRKLWWLFFCPRYSSWLLRILWVKQVYFWFNLEMFTSSVLNFFPTSLSRQEPHPRCDVYSWNLWNDLHGEN